MPTPDSHCHACGTAFGAPTAPFPRRCGGCGTEVYQNPIPVAVLLLPVATPRGLGLVVARRGIEPRRGFLALVGGFVEVGETWQAAAARELHEEIGLTVAAGAITPFWFTSTAPRPNRVLLFGEHPPLSALPPFEPTAEASERGLVFGPDGLAELFAFPLHAEAAVRWFAARGISGPHGFLMG